MAVTLLFFGKLMDSAGSTEMTMDLPAGLGDSEALRHWVDEALGMDGALRHPSVRVAVNDEILAGAAPVRDGDEVAFMPPVGGG